MNYCRDNARVFVSWGLIINALSPKIPCKSLVAGDERLLGGSLNSTLLIPMDPTCFTEEETTSPDQPLGGELCGEEEGEIDDAGERVVEPAWPFTNLDSRVCVPENESNTVNVLARKGADL